MTEHRLTIRDGGLVFIYADAVRALLDEGPASIARASHVEPTGDHRWTADMGPVGGPVLGPFPDRATALAAEGAWLQAYRGL